MLRADSDSAALRREFDCVVDKIYQNAFYRISVRKRAALAAVEVKIDIDIFLREPLFIGYDCPAPGATLPAAPSQGG